MHAEATNRLFKGYPTVCPVSPDLDIKQYKADLGTRRRDFILETGRFCQLSAILSRMEKLEDVIP